MKALYKTEMWELLAASLIYRASRSTLLHQRILPAEMEQAQLLINDCLDERKPKPSASLFAAACDVARAFGLDVVKKQIIAYKKRCTIDKHLLKNHWQIAMQMASSKDSLIYLYNCLRKVSQSRAEQCSAASYTVPSITLTLSYEESESSFLLLHLSHLTSPQLTSAQLLHFISYMS